MHRSLKAESHILVERFAGCATYTNLARTLQQSNLHVVDELIGSESAPEVRGWFKTDSFNRSGPLDTFQRHDI